ncbi:MAG TPA: hypothetical protein DCE41_01735, partial [Cytophagales bacterium]|nr:hypothetical protein [Cytophagales bacterium]
PDATVTVGNARFTVLTPQLIRMEWSETGQFVDASTFVVVNRLMPVPEFTTRTRRKATIIKTEALTLTYSGEGAAFTPENLSIVFTLNDEKVTWKPGMEDAENLRGTSRTLDGMTGGIQWDGSPLELEPGLLSRSGWALIDDSQNFQFDDSDWAWVQKPTESAQQDWYFLGYGHAYTQALQDYTRIAGPIPMLPRYAFGYWWSRYWVYSDPELRQLMQEMRSYDIPIDVLIIDMDWH